MNNNWITEQTNYNISQWDISLEDNDSDVKNWNRDADKYFDHVCKKCNFFDAIKIIEWNKYIKQDSKILDLGCGGGWLSAYLSIFQKVSVIYSLDTSKNYLFNIMPGVIRILKGITTKIIPIEGMFSPLLIEKDSLDIIVASAAVHHADNLEELLKELNSKMKQGGYLMLLNETPQGHIRYTLRILKSFIKIFINTITKQYYTNSAKISSSGFEYDPYLGDKSYPLWYWEKALSKAGFKIIKFIDSELPTVKKMSGVTLKHLICEKI